MKQKHLATVIGYLRGLRTPRISALPLAAGLLVIGTLTSAKAADIRSFGARCDGSDDSGAINAAFNSLANGDTLQLGCTLGIGPSGVLLHNKQGVIVDGSGGNIIGLASNPARILVRVEACSGCTIRNLAINANNVGAAGLSIWWSSNSSLENNSVQNVNGPSVAGIVALGNSGNRYVGNIVAGTSDANRGMWIGNADTQVMDRNATISNNQVRDISATGIVVQGPGANITGNVVERAQGAGIKIEPVPGQGGQTVLDGNTLRNNAWHGVQCEGCDAPVIIRNNTFSSNGVSGVYTSGGGFVGGQIINNNFTGNVNAGIYMYDGRNVTIQNNGFSGNGNGIAIEADPPSSLSNVTISSNSISSSNADGVAIWGRGGSFSGLAVNSNNFTNNRRYGMSMEESYSGAISNVSLNSNCFSGNGVGSLLDLRVNRLSVSVSSGCQTLSVGVSGGSTTTSGSTTTTSSSSTSTTSTTSSTTSTTSSSTSTSSGMSPIRVNAGGGQYTDSQGNVWSGDMGFAGGYTDNFPGGIGNTNDAPLYYTGRWNSSTLDYSFQVPSGTRTVTLKFAESYFQSAGQRVFDVAINGQTVLSNFDILAASGGPRTAIDKTFQVNSGGQIQIHFTGRRDDPFISAIEIK